MHSGVDLKQILAFIFRRPILQQWPSPIIRLGPRKSFLLSILESQAYSVSICSWVALTGVFISLSSGRSVSSRLLVCLDRRLCVGERQSLRYTSSSYHTLTTEKPACSQFLFCRFLLMAFSEMTRTKSLEQRRDLSPLTSTSTLAILKCATNHGALCNTLAFHLAHC